MNKKCRSVFNLFFIAAIKTKSVSDIAKIKAIVFTTLFDISIGRADNIPVEPEG